MSQSRRRHPLRVLDPSSGLPGSETAQPDVPDSLAPLFEPISLGGVRLRNRIVMLSHGTIYGRDFGPSAQHHHYYLERARAGVGLITVESLNVHPSGRRGGAIVDAFDSAAMLRWRPITEAAHVEGAKMFAQLSHNATVAFPAVTMQPLLAPSAVATGASEMPKAMDAGDIAEIQDAFAVSAANAHAAGFDGVELKVCHGGLLRMFLSPFFNQRTDEYGGSPENRARFVLETIATVRAAIGADMALGMRLSIEEGFSGGYGREEGLQYARLLEGSGALDFMTADLGCWEAFDMFMPPMDTPEGYADAATGSLKAAVSVPVVAFGRIKRPDHAARILMEGTADLVGMARQLIADPEWLVKVREGRHGEIRPCVACNQECIDRSVRSLPISCVHNPAAGREAHLGSRTRSAAERVKRVVVVGGGPAGLKAAESAALRGHSVVLFERRPRVGGQVAIAALAPGHEEWGEIVWHLEARVEQLGVEVHLRTEVTADRLLAECADAIVLAAGAAPGPPPFATTPGATIFDSWQVLTGDAPRAARVALVDLGTRAEPAALLRALLERGNAVRWIAPTASVGAGIELANRIALMRRLSDAAVERMPESAVVEAGAGYVLVRDLPTGRTRRLEDVDAVVIAGNRIADSTLSRELERIKLGMAAIGDCVAPRHVTAAIYEGELAGRRI